MKYYSLSLVANILSGVTVGVLVFSSLLFGINGDIATAILIGSVALANVILRYIHD